MCGLAPLGAVCDTLTSCASEECTQGQAGQEVRNERGRKGLGLVMKEGLAHRIKAGSPHKLQGLEGWWVCMESNVVLPVKKWGEREGRGEEVKDLREEMDFRASDNRRTFNS